MSFFATWSLTTKVVVGLAVVAVAVWYFWGEKIRLAYSVVSGVKTDKPAVAKLGANGKYLEMKYTYGGKEYDLYIPYSMNNKVNVMKLEKDGRKVPIAHPPEVPFLLKEKDADFRFELCKAKHEDDGSDI